MKQMKSLLSGEWMLADRSNGGFVILFRTLWVALPIYAVAVLLVEVCAPDSKLEFSGSQLAKRVSGTVPWLGAVVGAVYAALYARFSSQWQYLAQLYNQLMEFGFTEDAKRPENKERWNNWRAGFVEDAYTLHLACKPMFASAISQMLSDRGVQEAYRKSTLDADKHLAALLKRFQRRGIEFQIFKAS